MGFRFKMKCFGFETATDQIWYSECNYNALICLDRTNGRIREIVRIPGSNVCDGNLYSLIFKMGRDLILIPNRSNRITCYNMDNGCFSSISIDGHVTVSAASNYTAAHRYGDEIIMLPNRADKIIVYNHPSRTITTIEMKNDLLDKLYPNRRIQFRPQYEVVEDDLFIPFSDAGAILKMHLPSKRTEIKLVPGLAGCDTINYHNGIFYLASWDEKKIYALNKELCIIEEYTKFPDDMKSDKMIFAYSILIEEKLLFFPLLGDMIVSLDLKDKTIRKEMQIGSVGTNQLRTYFTKKYEDKIISLMAGDFCPSVFFYADDKLYKNLLCAWDTEYNNKVIKKYLVIDQRLDIVYENDTIGPDALIELLKDIEIKDHYVKAAELTETLGEKIYKTVIE